MSRGPFQLAGDAARIYEAQKVPAIFRPLARATLDRLDLRSETAVLDAACGTGIVARELRARVPVGCRVTGVDLSAAMIAVARQAANEDIDWHVADIAALPFPDGAFSSVICQQGLQFFPDEAAALAEIGRVLVRAGRLVLTVWSAPSPLFLALARRIEAYAGAEIATRSLAPFGWAGLAALTDRLAAAGLEAPERARLKLDRVLKADAGTVADELRGNPAGALLASRDAELIGRIAAATLGDLAPYLHGDRFVIPQETHLLVSRRR